MIEHQTRPYEYLDVFGFNVFSDDLDKIQINDSLLIINTISPNSYGLSTKDNLFKKALLDSDYLVLDGVYFALASILQNGTNLKKNQGPEVFDFFMQKANQEKLKVFFLGSTNNTLEKIKERAAIDFPMVTIDYFSPPFKKEFSDADNKLMVDTVNNFGPDYLFVGMTCPKQEKWSYLNRNKLNIKMIGNIGAVLDWYAGTMKEISPIWWKLRLGWLIKLIQKPANIKRYPNILIFFYHLLLSMLKIKKWK
jgi:N-acetylglucosaminyldiphosphoundecaprenol N-acetyl-beta-D-mannosaminyltransferase